MKKTGKMRMKSVRIGLDLKIKVFREGGEVLNGIRVGRGAKITWTSIRGWGHFHS